MELKYILGILAFLVIAVGSANAFPITTTNDPAPAGISIDVDYQSNQITFNDTSSGVTNAWIKGFAYNLTIVPISVDSYEGNILVNSTDATLSPYWTELTNNQPQVTDNFGPFGRVYSFNENAKPKIKPTKIVVHFAPQDGFVTVPGNGYLGKVNFGNSPAGNQVVVHLAFNESDSIKVTGPSGNNPSIPEFPSMVLPVAAILGLMFILGRRNKV